MNRAHLANSKERLLREKEWQGVDVEVKRRIDSHVAWYWDNWAKKSDRSRVGLQIDDVIACLMGCLTYYKGGQGQK